MNWNNLTPSQLVNECLNLLTWQSGKNFKDLHIAIGLKEESGDLVPDTSQPIVKLDTLDVSVYNMLAGYVVGLTSLYVDTDIKVAAVSNKSPVQTKAELDSIGNYLGTLLIKAYFMHHDSMLKEVIQVMQKTIRIWHPDFRDLLQLVILFDLQRGDKRYRNLMIPLAQACTRLLYDYKQGVSVAEEMK